MKRYIIIAIGILVLLSAGVLSIAYHEPAEDPPAIEQPEEDPTETPDEMPLDPPEAP